MTEEVVMHPMLISALADQIVRERSGGHVKRLSRSSASPVPARDARPERRHGIRLALHPLIPRRAA
ncbi:MAG: hypothetical protein WCD11_04725 [Solirubrobacteraceae bacterium]